MTSQEGIAASSTAAAARSLKNLALLACIGLGLNAVLQLVVVATDLNYILLASEVLDGERPALADINDAEDALAYGGIAQAAGILVVGAATFLPWFFRAYRNLSRVGAPGLRYGVGWAIGAWFIPIFNWVRPKQIANDIWRASDPAAWRRNWHEDPVSSLVHWWWALWLGGGILGTIGVRVAINASETSLSTRSQIETAIEQERTGYSLDAIAALMLLAAAILAIVAVLRLTRRQSALIDAGNSLIAPTNPSRAPAAIPPPPPAPTAHRCTRCGELFGDEDALRAHTATFHPEPAGIVCTACGDAFSDEGALSRHIATSHSTQTKTCPDCAEEIQAAARKCRYCGYRFASPEA